MGGLGDWAYQRYLNLGLSVGEAVTVIMNEHDKSQVSAVSDRVLALNNGRMLALGTPEAVQSDPAVIEAYLGADVA